MTGTKIVTGMRTDFERFSDAVEIYEEGFKVNNVTIAVYFVFVMDFRRFLIDLKYDISKYESTQLFKQAAPFKTLFYG